MDNREFSKLLEKRTRDFAIRIIKLSTALPNTPEGREIRRQISKSGTSIGANYREANRARSRADFKSKIKICQSEASETQYWLEVIIFIFQQIMCIQVLREIIQKTIQFYQAIITPGQS